MSGAVPARVGWRTPHHAAGLLLAIGSAQMADAITFVRMVRDHGIEAELNPLVAGLAAMGASPLLLLLLKVLLVIEVVAISAIIARQLPAAGAVVATIAVVAGLVGAFSNVAVIGWSIPG
jgi:hypothetical protein